MHHLARTNKRYESKYQYEDIDLCVILCFKIYQNYITRNYVL